MFEPWRSRIQTSSSTTGSSTITSNSSESSQRNNSWTNEEQKLLFSTVALYGCFAELKPDSNIEIDESKIAWTEVKSHFPGHSVQDCYDKWVAISIGYSLKKVKGGVTYVHDSNKGSEEGNKSYMPRRKNRKKPKFSEEEKQIVDKMQLKLGNKWTLISSHLDNRTSNDVKNYWHTNKDVIITKRIQEKRQRI